MIYQLGGREPLISSWSEASQKDRILFPKNLEDIPAGIGRSEHGEFQGDYKRKSKTRASLYLILNPLLATFTRQVF